MLLIVSRGYLEYLKGSEDSTIALDGHFWESLRQRRKRPGSENE